jgi:hypothetical protein
MRGDLSDLRTERISHRKKMTRVENLLLGAFLCLAILLQLLAIYSIGKEVLQGVHPVPTGISDKDFLEH